jgi:hypothetical protein
VPVVADVAAVGDTSGSVPSDRWLAACAVGVRASVNRESFPSGTVDAVCPVGIWAIGTFVDASSDAYPLAAPLLAVASFRASAVDCAVETGLFASDVLSTFPSPRFVLAVDALATSDRFDAFASFRSSAVCCAVDTGFDASAVLSTFPDRRRSSRRRRRPKAHDRRRCAPAERRYRPSRLASRSRSP